MSSMIKSLLGLSISDTSSATSSSNASTVDVEATDHQSTTSTQAAAEASPVKKDNSDSTVSQNAATSIPEVKQQEETAIDEEAIKEAVQEYGEQERLAPFRTKQILKKALKPNPPHEPDPSECCGSSCDPCVKDLWREEVRVWKIARGIDPYALSPTINKADLDW